jgi:predicted amidohydrolase
MSSITIAVAQTPSIKGEIAANVQIHLAAVRAATERRADLIVFPELSLTGYEPELAAGLILAGDDTRLCGLREMASAHGITIIAGAPVASGGEKPHIGALIFTPHTALAYAKQHLHPGEEQFFSPGPRACVVEVKGIRVGVAICADTAQASHPRQAAEDGATVYVAGVLVTEHGYEADTALLQGYAARHHMAVAMANHSAASGGYTPAGKSAVWDEGGQLVACADGTEQSLLVAESTPTRWKGRVVQL